MFYLSKSITIIAFIILSCMQVISGIGCILYMIIAFFSHNFFKCLILSIELGFLTFLITIGLSSIGGDFCYKLFKSFTQKK